NTPYAMAKKRPFPVLAEKMREISPMPDNYSEEPPGKTELERASRKDSSESLYQLLSDPEQLASMDALELHHAACRAIVNGRTSHLSLLLRAGAGGLAIDTDDINPPGMNEYGVVKSHLCSQLQAGLCCSLLSL